MSIKRKKNSRFPSYSYSVNRKRTIINWTKRGKHLKTFSSVSNEVTQMWVTKKPQKQTTHNSEIRIAEAHSPQRQLRKGETKDAKNKQKLHLQT